MKGYELKAAMKKLEEGWVLTLPDQDSRFDVKRVVSDKFDVLEARITEQDRRMAALESKAKSHDNALKRARAALKSLKG